MMKRQQFDFHMWNILRSNRLNDTFIEAIVMPLGITDPEDIKKFSYLKEFIPDEWQERMLDIMYDVYKTDPLTFLMATDPQRLAVKYVFINADEFQSLHLLRQGVPLQ